MRVADPNRPAGAAADTEKKHGDKLADTLGKPTPPNAPADKPVPGDSPKGQGDKLGHAVDEAAKRRG